MKWSPTEPWLLVGDCCGNVSIWNVEKDVLKTRLAGQLAEMRLQWSPDGWTVTSEGIHPDMGLRVWNVETGKKLHYDMNRERTDIFTIDGFIRGKKYGRLGEIVQQKQGPSYHLSEFSNVLAWSPDGKYLISGDSDYAIRIYRATDGKLLHTLEDLFHKLEFNWGRFWGIDC
ncbi:MAG: WD40 repeat domain-containing protein [Planctomycetia bacterium]|nr:WD40 repeat domain-containing protein [Planctomycetia bacterium]